jgi:hypothetical protein
MSKISEKESKVAVEQFHYSIGFFPFSLNFTMLANSWLKPAQTPLLRIHHLVAGFFNELTLQSIKSYSCIMKAVIIHSKYLERLERSLLNELMFSPALIINIV